MGDDLGNRSWTFQLITRVRNITKRLCKVSLDSSDVDLKCCQPLFSSAMQITREIESERTAQKLLYLTWPGGQKSNPT